MKKAPICCNNKMELKGALGNALGDIIFVFQCKKCKNVDYCYDEHLEDTQ